MRKFLSAMRFDLLGSLLYAIGISGFAQQANFAPGGISGLALIVYHLWSFPIGITSLLLNLPLAALSTHILGKRFLCKTLQSMLCCTIFLDGIFPFLPTFHGSTVLAALFSGIFLGAGMAIFYMHGSSSGGTDFLTLSIQTKHPEFSIGFVTMAIDFIIILLGWPVFGNLEAVLYGILSTAICSIVMDKLLYHVGAAKTLLIITDHGKVVATEIARHCQRSSIAIRVIGNDSEHEKTVLICACSNAQAYRIQKITKKTDAHAFMILMDSNVVFGEGFQDLRP